VKLQHGWSSGAPVFDDPNLVSCAGVVPAMALAEQAGLSELIAGRVSLASRRVASAGVNPAGKLTSIIAGMAAGADSIDDLDLIRSGGMPRLFGGVYAPATLGQFLREFTHGHCLQLASVLRAHLVNLARRTDLLPGIADRALIDIDSLLRPVFGHAKQGASYGHTKIAGKQVLRKGLSPLATTISTDDGAPVLPGSGSAPAGPARAEERRRWSPTRSGWPGRPAPPAPSWFGATRPTAPASWPAPAFKRRWGSRWCWSRTVPSPGRSAPSPRMGGPRCTIRARCSTPTPGS